MRILPSIFFILVLSYSPANAQSPVRIPRVAPEKVGLNAKRLARIDTVVAEAIRNGDLPGAVVLVLRRGKIAMEKAYGQRSVEPERHKMTVDTIFDLASLTKPIVTATCLMLLLEEGKIRLSDPVSRYLPGFNDDKQKAITIRHLLLHTSGLIPDNSIRDYQMGIEVAWQKLSEQKPIAEPGQKFQYSDVGFLLLVKIVENVSGESLDTFAHKRIFSPLQMQDTGYNPPEKLWPRIAPTEKRQGKWLTGKVHDPRAWALGGVAGHAGLFSSAQDLALFCQMLLNRGQFAGTRILSPVTVRVLTEGHEVPGGKRSLGWDVDTGYSSNRGELFGKTGFGHTGFTGTSIWIDPETETAVLFLSNRVHPNGRGNVIRLRNQIASIVAGSIEE